MSFFNAAIKVNGPMLFNSLLETPRELPLDEIEIRPISPYVCEQEQQRPERYTRLWIDESRALSGESEQSQEMNVRISHLVKLLRAQDGLFRNSRDFKNHINTLKEDSHASASFLDFVEHRLRPRITEYGCTKLQIEAFKTNLKLCGPCIPAIHSEIFDAPLKARNFEVAAALDWLVIDPGCIDNREEIRMRRTDPESKHSLLFILITEMRKDPELFQKTRNSNHQIWKEPGSNGLRELAEWNEAKRGAKFQIQGFVDMCLERAKRSKAKSARSTG